MITESGRIMAIEPDCLWVETIQSSTCQSCAAQKGCGQSLVAKWSGQTSYIRVLLEGRDPAAYQMHQQITIGIPEEVVARGSLLVYITPLAGLLLGALASNLLQLPEWGIMLSSLTGFGLGALAVRWHSAVRRNDPRVQPVLVDELKPVQWAAPG
ncbi:SoxR reducing system RseC family protein [Pseudomaricurvus sp. HS19]|uniref:SoxR reducing system RseC family protein n=1 Tax=Pseudomaricurvus sp. HS19 TaxID=2692626 RepID=UPI00136BC015|nr:SoxR reducing system RseC family protein [Pseudomaricurvus sp. HS19]MYM62592.1 transcriptional regulator [Pseudomaricurvus sp. HS19]